MTPQVFHPSTLQTGKINVRVCAETSPPHLQCTRESAGLPEAQAHSKQLTHTHRSGRCPAFSPPHSYQTPWKAPERRTSGCPTCCRTQGRSRAAQAVPGQLQVEQPTVSCQMREGGPIGHSNTVSKCSKKTGEVWISFEKQPNIYTTGSRKLPQGHCCWMSVHSKLPKNVCPPIGMSSKNTWNLLPSCLSQQDDTTRWSHAPGA